MHTKNIPRVGLPSGNCVWQGWGGRLWLCSRDLCASDKWVIYSNQRKRALGMDQLEVRYLQINSRCGLQLEVAAVWYSEQKQTRGRV